MPSFEISVNGKVFTNWKTAVADITMDENSGKFQFSSSNVVPSNYPVRAGDSVQVLINGKAKITGFCDRLESTVEDGIDTITVSGRDNVSDLIDSTMPDSVKSMEGPMSMRGLCFKVIGALGANIGVINSVPDLEEFGEDESFISDAGKNCMGFLTDFARKKQVYLVPDGRGNLEIFRPNEVVLPGSLINRKDHRDNNIISSTVLFDHSQRFGIYSCRSQDNYGSDPNADYGDGVDIQGLEIDEQIRQSRFIEIQPEESMNEKETRNRALEELNIRRARSTSYTALVAGVERAPGTLWEIGQLTKVHDDFSGMVGLFIVRSLSYSVDKNSGTRTKLTMAPPEAYQVRKSTQGDSRRAKQGDNLQTQEPPNSDVRFIR